jgi:uncharacterized membrane protein YqjE
MAGEDSPSRSRTRQAGFIGSLVALASALADFFESRAALFATESRAALLRLLLTAICLVQAAMFFAFGYIFLIATAVFGIAQFSHVSWVLIALIAAALHFLFAIILMMIAQARMKRPLFRATIDELKKDREWLKNLETNQERN